MASGDARIVVTVDSTGAVKSVQDFDKALEGLGTTTRDTTSQFDALWKGFTAGQLIVDGIRGAFGSLKQAFEDGIKGALAEEQSANRLTTALEMTGRAHGNAVQQMLSFARAQSQVTTYTHEEIEAASTLIEQLTRMSPAKLVDATRGAMGLATVLGENLEGAALRVARAYLGNAEGLRRVGIEIDGTLPLEQKQRQLMEALVPLYERATAELNTTGGQLKLAKNLWHEFMEQVGAAVLEGTYAKDTLPLITDGLKAMAKESENVSRTWKDVNVQWAAARGLIPPVVVQQMVAAQAAKDLTVKLKAEEDAFDSLFPAVAATRVPLLAFQKDTYDATTELKKFQDQWDRMEIIEVEASSAFKEIGNEVQNLDDILKELGVTVQGQPPDWDALYGAMEKQKAFIDDLASSLVRFGGANESILGAVGKAWGNMTRSILENLAKQVLAQELATVKIITLKKEETMADYIASIFSSMPWFIAIPMTIAAFAAVNALFSKIFKFAGGFEGIVRQPTLFLAGEAGPERVSVRNQTQMNNSSAVINVVINSPKAVDGNKVWQEIQAQARRRGIKVGRA